MADLAKERMSEEPKVDNVEGFTTDTHIVCHSSSMPILDHTDLIVRQALNDAGETKKIIRKIDWHLLPPLTLLYILAFIDRANIGNAKVAGMNQDLRLTGAQYNMVLTVFFFPYAVFEVPSNIVLKLMRPSRWITLLVVAWGTVCQWLNY